MGQWLNDDWQEKTEVLRKRPIQLPLFQSEIPHHLLWDWIWTSAVTNQQLTAWTIAWEELIMPTSIQVVVVSF
jgi:hypothetical protein